MRNLYIALIGAVAAGILASSLATAEQVSPAQTANVGGQSRPVVSEFIQSVLENHPFLASARANLTAARARARAQGRPLYNPELELGYENGEVTTREIGISQAFDFSGKRGARTRVANTEIDAAIAAFDLEQKSLRASLLMALADYQTSFELFSLSQHGVQLSEGFLELAERRNLAGDLPLTELLTARLALAEAKVEQNLALGRLSTAQEKLIALSGQERQIWPLLQNNPPGNLLAFEPDGIVNLAELRLARALSEASKNRIRVAQSGRIPDPTVGARFGKEGQGSLFGLNVSIPIPARNSYGAEVDAARAKYLASEQDYQAIYRNASARLGATKNRYLEATNSWRIWMESGATSLAQQRQIIEQLWQAGEISAVNYFVQLGQTITAEKSSIELRGRVWGAWFQWLDASGQIDNWMETIR